MVREYPITPGRIEGHGKRGKALTADYVLAYRNRKLAEIKGGLRFRRPLRVLESFPDAYAGGGVGGGGGFFSRCGARSTCLALCHARSFSGWRVYLCPSVFIRGFRLQPLRREKKFFAPSRPPTSSDFGATSCVEKNQRSLSIFR